MKGKSMIVLYVLLTALLAPTSTGFDLAVAQQGTPELPILPYPELHIRITDTGFEVQPEIEAGRYVAVVENAITDPSHGASYLGDAGADLMRLPEGVTLKQVRESLADLPDEGPGTIEMPEWVNDAVWAGGPIAAFEGTARTIVDLTPGTWVVLATNLGGAQSPQPLMVTGTSSTTPIDMAPVKADVPVKLQDFAFVGLPERVEQGSQIWELTNVSDQPHMMAVSKLPAGTTQEAVSALIAQASPAPEGLSFEDFSPAPGVGYLSAGQTAWAVLDLEPGSYVALCFVPDRETGMPHVLMGMAMVFTVGASDS
jgi:hypothetical protein